MCIQLKIKRDQVERAESLGAIWIPGEKTWVISDQVKDINPFKEWLPRHGGYIVKRPYFVARAKRLCHKCGKETPIVGLGAKKAHLPVRIVMPCRRRTMNFNMKMATHYPR